MNGQADQPPNSTRLSTVVPDMIRRKVRRGMRCALRIDVDHPLDLGTTKSIIILGNDPPIELIVARTGPGRRRARR